MSTIKALRDAHARAIAEDPVDIIIHRVELVDDGAGGYIKEETDLSPFTGRLVPSRNRPRENMNESGWYTVSAWLLLVPYDADVRAGDTFTANGRSLHVKHVIERRLGGEVFAVQADVEEVG